ncbi:multisubunit sodium/proton antiporter MrpG subunit [Litorimonas taeanensis]|uniref:Multisubunit sodium/proton antiporter MrpG subunit n=1 Tax=Litorimonas taeanensis TaxID=568099 RepID=A0A420WIS2_9PROT|nr:monovalent cation/H(+) antiporter subunit G [Litorimonas taeanensis]RKQ70887.1 multisubunit sodium/proton antiporter MrpG subunit [Litorimonas taeanensis]
MSLFVTIMAAAPAAAEHYVASGPTIDWLALLRFVGTVLSLAGGLFFVMAGTIGVIRLPDFYTRLHAAGMTDTLGAELILLGLIIQSGFSQMSLKLLLVAFFLLVTSPTATHAIAHAAYKSGLEPFLGKFKAPDLDEEV